MACGLLTVLVSRIRFEIRFVLKPVLNPCIITTDIRWMKSDW